MSHRGRSLKRRRLRVARAVLLVGSCAAGSLLLTACADPEPESSSATRALPEMPPEPAILAPGVISTSGFELGASFAPDGNTVYFAQIGDGFETSIIMSSRWIDDRWSPPQPVSFASRYRDIDPFVSPDGGRIFFQSDRPLAGSEPKDWDIWFSEQTDAGWSQPQNLGAPVNTAGVETYPVVTSDGSLYFSSDREGSEGGDVYRAIFVDGKYSEPENLGPPINTAEFDSNAFVSPDETYLILASSTLPGHLGSGDLYISHRVDGAWSELEHLPLVNTPAREFAPSVSPDGRDLLFTRDQRDPALGAEVLGDIYRIDISALGIDLDSD